MKAALKHLMSRATSGINRVNSEFSSFSNKIPTLLEKEWELFKKAMQIETEQVQNSTGVSSPSTSTASSDEPKITKDNQAQVDRIRLKIGNTIKNLEAINR